MDLTLGSLFSGIGGLDLGLERAGMTVRWQVENDPWCQQILEKHWPDVARYGDIHDLDPEDLEPVDVIAGGFPCQDISSANTNGRNYLQGRKSGLWYEFYRIITRQRPAWVVVENVSSGAGQWVPLARRQLARLGYWTVPVEVQAAAVGAPHLRPRVFLVGNSDSYGESTLAINGEVAGMQGVAIGSGHWRVPFSGPSRVANGIPRRVDRLRGLGNAVVPQVAEVVGRLVVAHAERSLQWQPSP